MGSLMNVLHQISCLMLSGKLLIFCNEEDVINLFCPKGLFHCWALHNTVVTTYLDVLTMTKRDPWVFLRWRFKEPQVRRGNCASVSVLRLVFLSWIYPVASLHAFLCVYLASCHLHLPEFHPSICPCSSLPMLPFVCPVILLIVCPLVILTYPSLLSLCIFCYPCLSIHLSISTCKVNEDSFDGSIFVSLFHFTEGSLAAKGRRTRK